MSRAVMQQALEALEWAWGGEPLTGKELDAITALRAALAEPEQKVWCDCGDSIEPDSGAKCGNCVAGDSAEPEQEPVAWMDIDDKGQRHGLRYYSDGSSDEVPLYTAPTPQPDTDCHLQGICQRSGYSIAPTPRKPLTDEEIDGLRLTTGYAAGLERFTFMARAIERAHGIGEQHE